ncbi:hypothetical protein [Amycolatopsis taiwanensis]|uniref:Uncharacterized protein n=1 Tax=Amycolatopsis taiwanensis TaxID=342230 RepID=A0A9W6R5F6_9PSEU|nr:hypothetical protein [Amycolatopsis taiwanensis]GLY67902.1 hypothetical protein Atai01_45210 [Amycolatopsis taiwanensis]
MHAQNRSSELRLYHITARDIMLTAVLDVLAAAGFQTFMDFGHRYERHRQFWILSPPTHPIS